MVLEKSDEYWQSTYESISFDKVNKPLLGKEMELKQKVQKSSEDFKKTKSSLNNLKFSRTGFINNI